MFSPDLLAFIQERRAVLAAEMAAYDGMIALLSSQPDPAPAPQPVPDPAPAPQPESVTDALMAGTLASGAQTSGRDIAGCTDPAVLVSPTTVTVAGQMDTFADWNIGTRRLVFAALVKRVANITSVNGSSGAMPLIHVLPGGGFEEAEFVTVRDASASMVFKQEKGGVAGRIRRWDVSGMSQDAFKVTGGNIIEECRIVDAIHRGGAPHADVLTVMAADGGVVFRNNAVDWNYANRTDQAGINNWFRIEPYQAGNVFDDIVIEDNLLIHANDRSFAMQVVEKNAPEWRGAVRVRNNRMLKAGGARKILYAPSPRIAEWVGNVDLTTGAMI